MKILSYGQIKEADSYTIKNEPIASVDLMERAATVCFHWIRENLNTSYTFKVFCGTGNNGGDGLALARMLHKHGYVVCVFVVNSGTNATPEFNTNETRLKNLERVNYFQINSQKEIPLISKDDIVIDALLGIGLNKPIEGILASVIEQINQGEANVISIDIPSGLFADKESVGLRHSIVKATYTLSFQLYKIAFLFAENAAFIGQVIILPIGLSEMFINSCNSNFELVEEGDIRQILKKREPFSHKGTHGRAIIIAGSYGKMGAAVLAAKACLRTGAGLLTVHLPKCGYEILQISVPEAMVMCDSNENFIGNSFPLETFTATGIGPGMGTSKETADAVKQIIKNFYAPMVIDADALNIISENKTWLEYIPAGTILTPHIKEFERLAGKAENDFDRNKLQIEFSKRHNVFIVLKGHYTSISTPDGMCYFNPTGNPGMAKAGTGDTLTGMLTALLSQGYPPKQTCIAGVYLHGLAADIAVRNTSEFSLLASDIIENISNAFLQLQH